MPDDRLARARAAYLDEPEAREHVTLWDRLDAWTAIIGSQSILGEYRIVVDPQTGYTSRERLPQVFKVR